MTRMTRILRTRIIVLSWLTKSMRSRIKWYHRYTCWRRKSLGLKYKRRSLRTTTLERGRDQGIKKWTTCSLMRLKRPLGKSRKKSRRIGMCKNRTLRRLKNL